MLNNLEVNATSKAWRKLEMQFGKVPSAFLAQTVPSKQYSVLQFAAAAEADEEPGATVNLLMRAGLVLAVARSGSKRRARWRLTTKELVNRGDATKPLYFSEAMTSIHHHQRTSTGTPGLEPRASRSLSGSCLRRHCRQTLRSGARSPSRRAPRPRVSSGQSQATYSFECPRLALGWKHGSSPSKRALG